MTNASLLLSNAVLELRPGAEFTVRGETLEWHDAAQSRPTDEEIAAKLAEIANRGPSYRQLRAVAYRDQMGAEQGDFIRTIGDVLDVVLGWAEAEIAAGRAQATPEMARALAIRSAIKARYPKPQE